jgi:aldehyde dehydrogenase (NAD+)
MLAWKVAPALAMGNTVVLKPAEYTSLTALLFADICGRRGCRRGCREHRHRRRGGGRDDRGASEVDKIAFTGSTEVGRRRSGGDGGDGEGADARAGRQVALHRLRGRRSRLAVEGLVDAIWFNQGQVCCAGSRLLVQEGIAERFHAKLRARMDGLRVGDPLDKCIDVGAMVDPVQRDHVVGWWREPGRGVPGARPDARRGVLLSADADHRARPGPLMQEEIFGPVLVSTTFRTPAEAVSLPTTRATGWRRRSGPRT